MKKPIGVSFLFMKIFKPLINLDSYDTFIKERLQKGTPSAYRFGKRYGIVIQDNEVIYPASIQHMFGFVRNVIISLCENYKHGRIQVLWIKKDIDNDGPQVTKKLPNEKDDYRQLIILNRVDHLIHLLVTRCIKERLNQDKQLIPVKSRIKNIQVTSALLKKAFLQEWTYYYSTDIKKFGESFDLEKAKNTLIRLLDKHIDTEDIVLINNLLSSYQKIPQHKSSGSPLNQLLAELTLSQIEHEVVNRIPVPFVRSGEDFVFCLKDKNDYAKIEETLGSIIKDKAGDKCELHRAKQTSSIYDARYQVNFIFNTDNDKGFIGSFHDPGIDFCGFNYSIENENIVVRIRYKTLNKIRERIKMYTEGGDFRTYNLPEEIPTNKKIKNIIRELNSLFGFYFKNNEWHHSRLYGIHELFKLPSELDSGQICNQAQRLNHYMLRRLRHLHMRNICNDSVLNARQYREEIDKSYRKLGLRNLIDSIKCY